MPRIRRRSLPPALLLHLIDRVQTRQLAVDQLQLFADWCASEPAVPAGAWFKRFPGLMVCGEGELVKTFLVPGQVPHGQEVF